MSPSQAFKAGVGGRDVAGLALGIVGVLVALLSPAIVSTVAMMTAVTAIVLGFAALTSRRTRRKALVIWGIALGVATVASAAAIFGVGGSAYAFLIFVLPTLIGLAAIRLGLAGLTAPNGRSKPMAILTLLLGAITVAMCMFGIVRVNRALKAPNPAIDSHREAVAPSSRF